MTRVAITAPGAATVGPYSHAVEGAGLLFLSGQTPLDRTTGKLVTGSIGEQALQCFANLGEVLEAAGLTFDDVVNVQVYLTDMNDFAAMNEVYAQQFRKPFPARTTIGVASLPFGARIEIGMTAKTSNATDSPYAI
jgi:2-iminobutanoate/2-iminopropanoate deaminase